MFPDIIPKKEGPGIYLEDDGMQEISQMEDLKNEVLKQKLSEANGEDKKNKAVAELKLNLLKQ